MRARCGTGVPRHANHCVGMRGKSRSELQSMGTWASDWTFAPTSAETRREAVSPEL